METFSLFKNEHFDNSNEDKKSSPKKFLMIIGIILGSMAALVFLGFVIDKIQEWLKSRPRSIKYLTSSTSPEFNLTYTPNL
jgi:hypothetical protein